MEKNQKNGEKSALGAEPLKPLTEDKFNQMVENDLRTAHSFLAAVYNDPPTMKALQDYLYGRYLNQLHKAELEQQTKIEA